MSTSNAVSGVKSKVAKVKDQAQPLLQRGQKAMIAGVNTIKNVNEILTDSVHDVVITQKNAGRQLIDAAQHTLETARSETADVVSKTGAALAQTLKDGYHRVAGKLAGELTHKEQAVARKAAVKAKKKAGRTTAAPAQVRNGGSHAAA